MISLKSPEFNRDLSRRALPSGFPVVLLNCPPCDTPHDSLTIIAPFGLDDLFAMRLRPNPIRPTNGFERTAGNLTARWPEVRVEA